VPHVVIRDQRNNPWIRGQDFTPPELQHQFNEKEQLDATLVRVHSPGDEVTPQLFELSFSPNFAVDFHSHAADEIFYVVKGSLEFGKRSLGPGSSVLIPADTLYAFKAGADGLQMLNFRPRADSVYRTREQHIAWMREREPRDAKEPDPASGD